MSSASRTGATGALVRRTWRRTWRSHLVLGAIIVVSTAAVMAVLIGAHRAESAQDRLRAVTLAADVAVSAGERPPGEVVDAVRGADGVTAAGTVRELFVRPVGTDYFPDYQLLALAPGSVGDPLDRSLIVRGRAPDPGAVDEIAMSEDLAAELDVVVGDTVALESMSDGWVDAAFNGGDPGPPDGPVVEAVLVGLARTPADFGRWAAVLHLTDAFADRYVDEIRIYDLVEARLEPATLARAVQEQRFDVPGLPDAEVQLSFFAHSTATEDGLRTIATALRLIGLAAAVAGLTAAALTLVRLAREVMVDRGLLVAIGLTRRELGQLVVAIFAPAVFGGIALGAALGVLVSPYTSLGLAWAVDPAGDGLVVAGWTVGAVLAGATILGALLLGLGASRTASRTVRPVRDGWALPALGRPLAAPLGLRRALFGGGERGGRMSRSATAAATVGVVVAVGALLVGSSIGHLQDDPRLSGQGAPDQRVVDGGEDPAVFDRALAVLEADPRVSHLVGVHVAFGVQAEGVSEITALIHDVRRGSLDAVTLRGRAPVQPDEVAIGPADLEAMGLTVGDEVELSSDTGSASFRIVGVALFPEGDFAHDSGVVLTADGAKFLGGPEAAALHQLAYSWAPGVDASAADQSLVEAGLRPFTTDEGLMPAVVTNLGEVRSLPGVLAGLVLLLSLASILHAVALTSRQRHAEAGTLRALGMMPRSVASVVEVHSLTMSVVALGAGLPLGVAAGRVVWTAIAERANVVDRPVVRWSDLGLTGAALVVASVLLALLPAVRTLRQRPAAALRVE